jgi:hypothetical protein
MAVHPVEQRVKRVMGQLGLKKGDRLIVFDRLSERLLGQVMRIQRKKDLPALPDPDRWIGRWILQATLLQAQIRETVGPSLSRHNKEGA